MIKTLTFLLISILFSLFSSCQEKVILYPELPAYNVNEEIQFDPSWFVADKKLVIASKSMFMFSLPFMDIVEQYDIPVLIYIAVEDKDKIIAQLQKYGFKHPFIHDPKAIFFEGNDILVKLNMDPKNTAVALFVEGNIIKEVAQIGMRQELKKQLERFAK
jgi:hypothetical protein